MISVVRPSIVNKISIDGPVGPVFDLVTSARFWPQWHPATEAVGGVTQRPFQLGEFVEERGQIGPARFDITWKVVEHARPARAVLESTNPSARIVYAFRGGALATELQRKLEYEPAAFAASFPDPDELERYMHNHSEQALKQLKELIETILREEITG
jgi:hypothetical protein